MRSQISVKTHRIYLNTTLLLGEIISISDPEIVNYIKNVLRLKYSEQIRVFNQACGEYLAEIHFIDRKIISIKLIDSLIPPQKAKVRLVAGIGILKPPIMLDAINIAVQLGVDVIYPIITERCQFRDINNAKCHKVIITSAEQCERLNIPELMPPTPLNDFLKKYKTIFAANEHSIGRLNSQLEINEHETIAVLIGPEGGFSLPESELLSAKHVHSVKLRSNILRSEIALVALIAQIDMLRA